MTPAKIFNPLRRLDEMVVSEMRISRCGPVPLVSLVSK